MNSHQINKILNLIKRTGDKFVVMDKDSDEAYVMMDVMDYEDLLTDPVLDDLSEEEMLSKVNRDLSNWRIRNERKKDYYEDDCSEDDFDFEDDEIIESKKSDLEPWELEDIENEKEIEDDFDFEDENKNELGYAPTTMQDVELGDDFVEEVESEKSVDEKVSAEMQKEIEELKKIEPNFSGELKEESLEDVKEDDEEEDRFYLEPVE